ncbi:hypothetical protein [Parasediminibacterium sp. JCM 36343]|uniref:hypothetical protein n=1 Tax=Parasediminibacterium sp. JCM 36343 TaxID=3374279 RepID=UPI00397C2AC6
MYIKKLYHTNKWWFGLIMCFVLVQMVMDAKQGAAISPVYHYLMFSDSTPLEKKYTVAEITVNGQLLQTQHFSPYMWDKIDLSAEMYQSEKALNSRIWNKDIKRLLHFKDSTKYVNHISPEQFNNWYKSYLQTILHKKVDSFSVVFADYRFDGNSLTKITN